MKINNKSCNKRKTKQEYKKEKSNSTLNVIKRRQKTNTVTDINIISNHNKNLQDHHLFFVSAFLLNGFVSAFLTHIYEFTNLISRFEDPASSEFSISSLTTLTTDVITCELDSSRTVSGGRAFMPYSSGEKERKMIQWIHDLKHLL